MSAAMTTVMTALIDVAEHDPNPRLRQRAVFWLSQSKDPRAIAVLVHIVGQQAETVDR